MVQAQGNFADLLEPIVKAWFLEALGEPDPMIDMLFNVGTSDSFQEEYQGIGGRPLIPPFDGTVRYAGADAQHRHDIRNFEFADGILINRDLWDDDKTNVMRGLATGLGSTVRNTYETDAVNVFINGFTDTGLNRMGENIAGGDAVGLLSAAHPNGPIDAGTTQSNEGTLPLTLANLDTTRQLMRNFTDDKGNLLGIRPDMLLVPPEKERIATQILAERALYEPGSAQFDVNMFAGRLRPVVWDRLTDATAWFLIDSRQMKQHLHFNWRIRPEFANTTDFDSLQAKYRVYMRYGIGWDDWRWIFGQNGTS